MNRLKILGALSLLSAQALGQQPVIPNLTSPVGIVLVDPSTGIPYAASGGSGTITALTQDVTASGSGSVAATVVGINDTNLAALATGIIKNTTSTGVPSIAIAGTDYAGLASANTFSTVQSFGAGADVTGVSDDGASMMQFTGTPQSVGVHANTNGIHMAWNCGPTNTNVLNCFGINAQMTLQNSTQNVSNIDGYFFDSFNIASSYTGTLTAINEVETCFAMTDSRAAGSNVQFVRCFSADGIGLNNGTTGTASNYQYSNLTTTAGAGAGGNLTNAVNNVVLPSGGSNGAGGVTENDGIKITGNGGTNVVGTTTNWAINSTSTADSQLTGGLDSTPIGATTASTGAFTTLSSTGATTLKSPVSISALTGATATVQNSSPDTNGAGLGIQLKGTTATTTGAGGQASLLGGVGCCSGDGGVGGAANATGGAGSGTGNGGSANTAGGVGGATGAGGSASATGGKGGATSGTGGQANVTGGAAGDASAGNGGGASVTGGAGGVTSGTGSGGAAGLTGGAAGATSGTGGQVNITGGASATSGNGGAVVIKGGTGASANGAVSINPSLSAVANINTGTSTGAIHIGDGSGNNAIGIGNGTGVVTFASPVTMSNATIKLSGIASNTGAQTGYLCYSSAAGLLTYDGTNTCLVSARKFKKDIRALTAGLSEVLKLQPVSFYYKSPDPRDANTLDEQIGFIAEDVQKIEPRLVSKDSEGQVHGVRYEQMTALLVKALQDEQAEINTLKVRLSKIESKNDAALKKHVAPSSLKANSVEVRPN